jgi:hypothetical protein
VNHDHRVGCYLRTALDQQMELFSLSCKRLESMQFKRRVAGQRSGVTGIKDGSPHDLLPSRLEVVHDHDVEPPRLPSPRRDLSSNRVLREAAFGELVSSGHTQLLVNEEAQGH